MDQEELLIRIGGILNKLGIPYIITGGIAVVVWGRPRFTADIDVVIELPARKLELLAEEIAKIDKESVVDRDQMRKALETQGEFNFIHPASGLKVDFWILKNDRFDQERMKRRVVRKIKKQNIYFTSPEDLILIKLFWYKESGSTRQLEDIESIIRIQKKLDFRYIRKWATIQSTLGMFESLVKNREARK